MIELFAEVNQAHQVRVQLCETLGKKLAEKKKKKERKKKEEEEKKEEEDEKTLRTEEKQKKSKRKKQGKEARATAHASVSNHNIQQYQEHRK